MRNKKTVIIAAAEAVFMLLLVFLFHPRFETNDDFGMLCIVSGLHGKCDPHMIYSNILMGKLLCALYAAASDINWYVLFHFLVIYISGVLVTRVLCAKDDPVYLILPVVFNIFFLADAVINLQFTKTAGIAAVGGLLLIYHSVSEKKIRFPAMIIGILMTALSSMIRINSFLMVFACGALFLPLILIIRKDKIKSFVACALAVLLAAGISFSLRAYDRRCYDNDPDWKGYLSFNEARASVTDSPFLPYDENKDLYEKADLSWNDVALLTNWTFDDPDFFDGDKMEEIAEVKGEMKDIDKTETILKETLPGTLRFPFVIPVLLLLAVLIFKDSKNLIFLIPVSLVFLIFTTRFISLSRYLQYRVDLVIAMAVFALLCLVFIESFKDEKKGAHTYRYGVLALAVSLILNSNLYLTSLLRESETFSPEVEEEYEELYNKLYEDQDTLYLTVTTCDRSYDVYDINEDLPGGFYANTYFLGGWETGSPIMEEKLSNYGIDNPMRDMADKDNVRLIASEWSCLAVTNYLREHYGMDVEAQKEEEFGNYFVYKITSR